MAWWFWVNGTFDWLVSRAFREQVAKNAVSSWCVHRMRLHVIGGLAILLPTLSLARSYNERFDEDLTLRSLPDGKLLAHFDFTTHVDATMAPGSQRKPISLVG